MRVFGKHKIGFSIVELIVVIAIISLLSAIGFSQVQSARDKGTNSAIKSDMASARTEAEIFFNENNGSYSNMCWNTPVHVFLDGASLKAVGHSLNDRCYADSDSYVATAPLKMQEGNSRYWCIDSAKKSKGITNGQRNSINDPNDSCP